MMLQTKIEQNRMLILEVLDLEKQLNHQPDINKIYLYVKDPSEAKYQFLLKNAKKWLKAL